MYKKLIVLIIIVVLVIFGIVFVRNKQSLRLRLKQGDGGSQDGSSGTEESQPIKSSEVSGSFTKGQDAPEVTFVDFEGNIHMLSDFAGKAVLIDFWAGWCPFCVEEMPELQKAQDEYKQDLIVIGVHRTDTEKISSGQEFSKKQGISYLLVSDKKGSLYRAAGGFGMPVAIFIDKEGKVVEVKSGPKTKEEIKEKVSGLVHTN